MASESRVTSGSWGVCYCLGSMVRDGLGLTEHAFLGNRAVCGEDMHGNCPGNRKCGQAAAIGSLSYWYFKQKRTWQYVKPVPYRTVV